MKSIDLKAEVRKTTGKKSTRALRDEGLVPCVMYGGTDTLHFTVPENDFRHIIYTSDIFLINIDIDGNKHKAILQDTQFHPVSDQLLHVDFIEVFDDKPLIASLPVDFTGNSVGVRAGGKVRIRRRYLKVKGLIKDLPDRLSIDITDMKIGDVIKINNLSYKDLELLDPSQAMVVAVSTSRLAKGAEEEEEEEAAEAETAETEATEEGAES